MRHARFGFLVLFAVLEAGRADARDFAHVSVGVANQWSWTRSLDALMGGNGLVALDVRAGATVWDGLSVEVGYRRMTGDGASFAGSLDSELLLHAIDVGARYDLPLLSWLSAYGRLGATIVRGELDLRSNFASFAASDWSGGMYATAGLEARLPRRWFGGTDDDTGGRGFTAGLTFDIGFGWLAGLDMSKASGHMRGGPDDDEVGAMPSAPVALGALSIQGLYYQFGLALHY